MPAPSRIVCIVIRGLRHDAGDTDNLSRLSIHPLLKQTTTKDFQMNLRKTLLATALLALAAPAAYAQSTANLSVTGTITPASCVPAFSSGGTVDFGSIPAQDLTTSGHKALTVQNVTMTINCTAATRFALRALDNRASSVNAPAAVVATQAFGLGQTSALENIGAWTASIKPATSLIDAVAPFTTITSDAGATWSSSSNAVTAIRNTTGTEMVGLAAATGVTTGSEPVTVASLDLEIAAWIAPPQQLTLTAAETLDGSATFEVVYL
jgi:type 1 fimbria pilin